MPGRQAEMELGKAYPKVLVKAFPGPYQAEERAKGYFECLCGRGRLQAAK